MKIQKAWWIGSVALLGCGLPPSEEQSVRADNQAISWDEFKRRVTQVVDGEELYIVESDINVSERQLRERYEAYRRRLATTSGDVGQLAQPSIVARVNGAHNIWHGQQMNLTYCVSNDFGWYKPRAVNEMSWATAAWEWSARVNFVYLPEHDANCNNGNPSIRVPVRPWNGNGACAFLPDGYTSEQCPPRTLSINIPYYDSDPTHEMNAPNVESIGAFRHELGHVLGLRHEHARSSNPICAGAEGTDWAELTPYDQSSVMHYPFCDGNHWSDYTLTEYDIKGARRLYGEITDKLLWHHSSGPSQLWYMTSNGLSRSSYVDFPPSLNIDDASGWTPYGLGDFNKDGLPDIVWHHTSGPTAIWYMNGVDRLGDAWIGGWLTMPDSSGWRIAGLADFNKDGNTDILWHSSGGANIVWYMDGGTVVNLAYLPSNLNFYSPWRIDAVNDFNHDGNADWLLHNGTTGQMAFIYLDGINTIGGDLLDASLNIPDSSNWSLLGSFDFNRDGNPDLIWHHADGWAGLWYMNGTSVLGMPLIDSSLNLSDSSGWRLIRR